MPEVSEHGAEGKGVIVNVFSVEKSINRGWSAGELCSLGIQDNGNMSSWS